MLTEALPGTAFTTFSELSHALSRVLIVALEAAPALVCTCDHAVWTPVTADWYSLFEAIEGSRLVRASVAASIPVRLAQRFSCALAASGEAWSVDLDRMHCPPERLDDH